MRAFEGVDYVIHAAALKQVPACEYNPIEAVKTNISGAQNIVEAAIDRGVRRIVAGEPPASRARGAEMDRR